MVYPLFHETSSTFPGLLVMVAKNLRKPERLYGMNNIIESHTVLSNYTYLCVVIYHSVLNTPLAVYRPCNESMIQNIVCQYNKRDKIFTPLEYFVSTDDKYSCLPGWQNCSDNSCVLNILNCDGSHDCPSGDDETHCHIFKFRCHMKQCKDLEQLASGEYIVHVRHTDTVEQDKPHNDLIMDFTNGSDENIMKNIIRSEAVNTQSTKNVSFAPCWISNHPAWYRKEDKCNFNRYLNGIVTMCRNGKHLMNCTTHSCDKRFKCFQSYCIPWNYVCDDIVDCPHGDDEMSCTDNRRCPAMYRCHGSRICIHIISICDYVKDCPQSDDETNCEIPACPSSCSCYGAAASCRHSNYKNIPFSGSSSLAYLIMSETGLFSDVKIVKFTSLRYLDLSLNHIANIKKNMFNLDSLHFLNLSFNSIIGLTANSFDHLPSLHQLVLTGNPLRIIHVSLNLPNVKMLNLSSLRLFNVDLHVFRLMTSLESLDLSYNVIQSIKGNIHPLQLLDISNNKIIHFSEMFLQRTYIKVLRTSDIGLCCTARERTKHCTGWNPYYGCTNLIPTRTLEILSYVACITLVIICISQFIYKIKTQFPNARKTPTSNSTNSFLEISIAICNFTWCMLLVIILSINLAFSGVYPTYVTSWVSGMFCAVIGSFIQYMMFFRVHSVLVFLITRFYTIAYPLRSRKTDISCVMYNIAMFGWFIGAIVNLVLSLLWIFNIQHAGNTKFPNNLCLPLFDVRNAGKEPYKSVALIFITYVLLSLIFVVLSNLKLLKNLSDKNQFKNMRSSTNYLMLANLTASILSAILNWLPAVLLCLVYLMGKHSTHLTMWYVCINTSMASIADSVLYTLHLKSLWTVCVKTAGLLTCKTHIREQNKPLQNL